MATTITPGQPGYVPSNVGNPQGGGNYGPTVANPYGWSTVNGVVTANSAPNTTPQTGITTPPTSGSSGVQDPTLSGMMSDLEGLSSTITSDNASNTDLYNEIIASQKSQQAENDTALQEEEGSAVAAQQQANQAQTEGTAQTVAMLSQYHGVNTALTQFWSDLSTKQTAAVNNIKAQYDSAIASGDATSAAAIQSTMLDQIHTNQTQDQQMFDNAMGIFNGMTSVINNQQTQANSTATLNLQQQSLAFQQQQQITNATNQMNTMLSSLAGSGKQFSSLSEADQSQLTALAGQAGMSTGVLKTIINANANEAASTVQVNGPLGVTTYAINKNGDMIPGTSNYTQTVPMGSAAWNSTIQQSVTSANSSDPNSPWYIDSATAADLKIGTGVGVAYQIAGAMGGAPGKILDTTDSTMMTNYGTGMASAAQTVSILQGSGLPTDTNGVVTGAIGNSVNSAVNGEIGAFIDANPGIISTMMAASGGSKSGMAIRAILTTGGTSLITPTTDAATVENGLKAMAQIIASQANSIVPGYGDAMLNKYVDLTGSVTPITNGSMGSSSGTGNSGSTPDTSLIPGWNP